MKTSTLSLQFVIILSSFCGLITLGEILMPDNYSLETILQHNAPAISQEYKYPNLCELDDVVCPSEKTGSTREVTAYSEIDSCHTGKSCLMANGEKAHVGAIACPRKYPLGSKFKIGNLGIFICKDRTAKWVDGRFDIFMGYKQVAHDRAINFGIKRLEIVKQ